MFASLVTFYLAWISVQIAMIWSRWIKSSDIDNYINSQLALSGRSVSDSLSPKSSSAEFIFGRGIYSNYHFECFSFYLLCLHCNITWCVQCTVKTRGSVTRNTFSVSQVWHLLSICCREWPEYIPAQFLIGQKGWFWKLVSLVNLEWNIIYTLGGGVTREQRQVISFVVQLYNVSILSLPLTPFGAFFMRMCTTYAYVLVVSHVPWQTSDMTVIKWWVGCTSIFLQMYS